MQLSFCHRTLAKVLKMPQISLLAFFQCRAKADLEVLCCAQAGKAIQLHTGQHGDLRVYLSTVLGYRETCYINGFLIGFLLAGERWIQDRWTRVEEA